MAETVLIAGATGLIGKSLTKQLLSLGYLVNSISRNNMKYPPVKSYQWKPLRNEYDQAALNNVDYIVHLSGAGIAEQRWTSARKKIILESRTQSLRILRTHIEATGQQVKAVISGSAVGIYGQKIGTQTYTENHEPARDFLGETCRLWEEEADKFNNLGIRTVKIRTGIALSESGGALEKMAAPIKYGVGAALGSGKQATPWIHIDDLVGIFVKAIEDENMQGAYNAASPYQVSNKEFMRTLAKVLNRPFLLPNVPSFVLKAAMGEMADIVLGGSYVSVEKLQSTGFHFKYPELEQALRDLYNKW